MRVKRAHPARVFRRIVYSGAQPRTPAKKKLNHHQWPVQGFSFFTFPLSWNTLQMDLQPILDRLASDEEIAIVFPPTVGSFRAEFWVRQHTRDRLLNFLQRRFGEQPLFDFTSRDRLYLNLSTMDRSQVDLANWTEFLLVWLVQHNIPRSTSAIVRVYLRNPQGSRVGGASFIERRLTGIGELDIGDMIRRLNENGYSGVNLNDCEIELSFSVQSLIARTIRGGCIQKRQHAHGVVSIFVDEDQRHTMVIPQDMWLYRYSSWSNGQRAHMTSLNQTNVPRFLGSLRGIFYFGWRETWSRPVCGFMTAAYLVELFRYRVFSPEGARSRYDTSLMEMWERDLHLLYLHACRLADTFPGMLREAEGDMLTMHDLGSLVNWLEPRCTLVVYDDSRRRLMTRERTAFTVGDPDLRDPAGPFGAYGLTPSLYADFNTLRIYVYYDHTYRHYLPIFDITRFFSMPHQRRWLPSSSQHANEPPSMRNATEEDNDTVMVLSGGGSSPSPVPTSSKIPKFDYFISCPCCDILVVKNKVQDHVCRNALTCLACGISFASTPAYRTHLGTGYPQPCSVCHVKLYPACERAHRRICQNKKRLPRCPRCRGVYSVEPHSCQAYVCGRCGKRKRNLRVFDPCSGLWKDGMHSCYVQPSKQFSHAARLNQSVLEGQRDSVAFQSQQERLLDHLSQTRYFVFDFESMLDHRDGLVFPFVRNPPPRDADGSLRVDKITEDGTHLSPVYIHRVNCVSFCEMDLFKTLLEDYWREDHSLQALVSKIKVFLSELEVRVVDIETLRRNPIRLFMEQEGIPETPGLVKKLRLLFKLLVRTHVPMTTVTDLDSFWDRIVKVSTAATNVWYAHNLKGYDGRLLYDHLKDLGVVPENMLWRGGKVFRLQYRLSENQTIVFLDSINHVSTSLRKMPAMFGLNTAIVRKGMFPYRFNNAPNQTYRGALPDKVWFDAQWMRPAEYREFDIWYSEQLALCNSITTRDIEQDEDPFFKQAMIDRFWMNAPDTCPYTGEPKSFLTTGIYDLQTEMRLYCENDVLVLKLSLERYHLLCTTTTHCSPEASITVAQFTYLTYVNLYMPTDTIEYLDDNEYSFARRALRGGNTNVRQLYWEADPSIPGHGLRYIDVQSLYPSVQFYDPLPIGRPRIHYYLRYPECNRGEDGEDGSGDNNGTEEQALKPQPSQEFLSSFFGFIECDLTPLQPMFHPVVLCSTSVFNHSDHLSLSSLSSYHRSRDAPNDFVLVQGDNDDNETTGGDPLFHDIVVPTSNEGHVSCGSGSGKLIGPLSSLRRIVITSVELQEGLRRGLYRVDRVYRIDEYRSSDTLFKRFIQTWLRIKITSSPCPVDVNDPVAFQRFREECQQRYDFPNPLSVDDFRSGPNVGLRNFAKLQLNSLWGKFGQRTTLESHHILRTGQDHAKYATSCRVGDLKEVSSSWVDFGRPPPSGDGEDDDASYSDTSRVFGYLPVKICVAKRVNEIHSKNVAIASFVTAHARMRLWRRCFDMNERVVYHDTDSMIYEVQDGLPRVEEGHFLGDWESETGNRSIVRFVSIAPKTYAYSEQMSDGTLKDVVKSKGFFVHREAEVFFDFHGYACLLVGSLLQRAAPWGSLRSCLEATFSAFPGLVDIVAAYRDYESSSESYHARLRPLLDRWNRMHLTSLLRERFSEPGPVHGTTVDVLDHIIAKRRRLNRLLEESDAMDDGDVVLSSDDDLGFPCLSLEHKRWLIWKDMALPSRQLSIVHVKDQGVTISYQCLKSMTFYYGKGLICVQTLKTYPYGIIEQFPDQYDPSDFISFVGTTLVWPIRFNINSIDFSYAVGGPQYKADSSDASEHGEDHSDVLL